VSETAPSSGLPRSNYELIVTVGLPFVWLKTIPCIVVMPPSCHIADFLYNFIACFLMANNPRNFLTPNNRLIRLTTLRSAN
jgi:hypothetical protein